MKEFVAELDVKDEIGNEFRAEVTIPVQELIKVLHKHGYKLVKK